MQGMYNYHFNGCCYDKYYLIIITILNILILLKLIINYNKKNSILIICLSVFRVESSLLLMKNKLVVHTCTEWDVFRASMEFGSEAIEKKKNKRL